MDPDEIERERDYAAVFCRGYGEPQGHHEWSQEKTYESPRMVTYESVCVKCGQWARDLQ